MMHKLFFSIIFLIFSILCIQAISFADQTAVTRDGKQVILKDNKTWEYMMSDKDKQKVIKINLDVKRALKPFIARRDRVFKKTFDLEVDWEDNSSFDLLYRSVMEGLYYSAVRQSKINFTKKAEEAFGSKTAGNLVYLIENWGAWRDVVSK